MACALSKDSDQLGHPPSLIRVFAVRMKKAWVLSYPLHGGEPKSHHVILMIGNTCYFWKSCAIRVRLCLIFPLILVRFAWDLKQIPRKKYWNMPIYLTFLTKSWFKSYWRANTFFSGNGFTQQRESTLKRAVFLIFVCLICSHMIQMLREWSRKLITVTIYFLRRLFGQKLDILKMNGFA